MELAEYLKKIFGEGVKSANLAPAVPLPFYLKEGYELSSWVIHGVLTLFAKPSERKTPATLKTHAAQLSKAFGSPCIIYLEEIDPQEKKRLFDNGTSFIVPGVIFFAPGIGVSINERIKEVKKLTVEKLTPLSQVLYLYLLYNRNRLTKNNTPISYSLLSKETGLNTMAVKRAIDAFASVGIAKLADGGVRFLVGREEYIEKVLPYLDTPVKERFFVTANVYNKYIRDNYDLVGAGIAALQEAPYISDNRRITGSEQVYALDRKRRRPCPNTLR